jgi:hypothetical protein
MDDHGLVTIHHWLPIKNIAYSTPNPQFLVEFGEEKHLKKFDK